MRLLCVLVLILLVACKKLHESPYAKLGIRAPSVNSVGFAQSMEKSALAPWRGGNHIQTLANGDAYFPAMLESVRSAQKTITLETFVAVDGYVTRELVLALCERSRVGVNVHVILDGIGSSKLSDRYFEVLRKAGVQVEMYRPYRGLNCFRLHHINNRDHRKILVVDGVVAFTGGAGFADVWRGNATQSGQWRDTMYQIQGPLVADLQYAFQNNWLELGNPPLVGEGYFPPLRKVGKMKAQATLGAPYEREDTLGTSYLLAIDAAKKSILIEHSYFVPNQKLRRALVRARERGVEIEIILPNHTIDTPIVREVSKSYWTELLDAGIRIYEFQPCMLHGKLIVIDDALSIIGSGNFDDRTFFINDELNVHVLDEAFAREQRAMFERDRVNSRLMTHQDAQVELRNFPLRWFGRLIEPQL